MKVVSQLLLDDDPAEDAPSPHPSLSLSPSDRVSLSTHSTHVGPSEDGVCFNGVVGKAKGRIDQRHTGNLVQRLGVNRVRGRGSGGTAIGGSCSHSERACACVCVCMECVWVCGTAKIANDCVRFD